jgi:hypothetical protein
MEPEGSLLSSLVPVLSRINPVHTTPSYLRSILISTHLRLGLPNGIFPSGFPTKWIWGMFLGVKGRRRVRRTVSSPSVSPLSYKIWEPRRLTTLWASTACYRDSFTSYLSPIHAICSAHLILLDLIILLILAEECKSWSCPLCSFVRPPVTSSLCDPNILLNTLFSNTIILCSSLNVRDQVSHPYRTTGKITLFIILIFKFLNSREEDKRV